jgi:hypothetical protein
LSVDKYLNKSYCPQKYNCGHLVSEVWFDETGQDISGPMSGFFGGRNDRHMVLSNLRAFKRLKAPVSPCVVLLQSPGRLPHVGIYLRGRVLHISSRIGVRFELLNTFTLGYKKIGFFSC